MPMPRPRGGESRDEFVSRCMDDDVMKEDFSDNDQRIAVCFRQWRDRDKASENMETKQLDCAFEIKALDSDGSFSGYGSVFGVEDSYKEVVAPGAFKKTLSNWKKKGKLPPVLWQHDQRQPIGAYSKMREDQNGLYVEGKLLKDDIYRAKEAYALLKNGVISGLSIGYLTNSDDFDSKTGIRTLTELDLWEVSLVTFPANQSASITAVKTVQAMVNAGEIPDARTFEAALRDAWGLSRRQAAAFMADGYRGINQRDADLEALERLKLLIGKMRN